VALWLVLLMVLTLIVPTSAAAADRSTMDVRATYEARAKLTWSAGRLDVWSRARIQNTSGHGIERIDFNLVPARIGNMKNLAVSVGGERVTPRVTGQTIKVPLGRTLADGDTLTLAEQQLLADLDYAPPTSAADLAAEIQRFEGRLSDLESFFFQLIQLERELGIGSYLGF